MLMTSIVSVPERTCTGHYRPQNATPFSGMVFGSERSSFGALLQAKCSLPIIISNQKHRGMHVLRPQLSYHCGPSPMQGLFMTGQSLTGACMLS